MANTYAVYNSGGIVIEYWCGDVYFDEVVLHQIKQQADQRITPSSSEIIDFRDANLCFSDSEVVQFSARLANNKPAINKPVKRMALVTQLSDWDQACLYSQKAWGQDVEVVVFHTLDAACAWIDFDSKHIEKKLKQLKLGLMVEEDS
jgi:hypothetical protein